MEYRSRETVDAFIWTGDIRRNAPDWFRKAIAEGKITIKHENTTDAMVLIDKKYSPAFCPNTVTKGGYVVTTEDGRIYGSSAIGFMKEFKRETDDKNSKEHLKFNPTGDMHTDLVRACDPIYEFLCKYQDLGDVTICITPTGVELCNRLGGFLFV